MIRRLWPTKVVPHRTIASHRSSESAIVLCRVKGLTSQVSDLVKFLKKEHVVRDYVLRRDRQEHETHVHLAFENHGISEQARRVLSTRSLNGASLRVSVHHELPPIYDPLHLSPESGPGRVVSIEGLPWTTSQAMLQRVFAGYALVKNADFQFHRVKQAADLSTWLIRTRSEEEAQRIVRHVNATFYDPGRHGRNYPLRAEVFY